MSRPDEPAFPSSGFHRFWVGETVSSFGTYVTLLALQTIVVLTLQGDAQDVGWLNSARWLPYLLLGQLLYGFGLTFSNSHEMAYRQTLTPDVLQARTNTTMRAANRAVFLVAAAMLVLSPFRRANLNR